MTAKLKNKVNKKTGNFICNRCGLDVGLCVLFQRRVYCLKCFEIIKGIRDENGTIKDQRTIIQIDDLKAMRDASRIRI